ncbi:hypothetical protein F5Y12DRAFT_761041 [Xylaria sp. FL1777]|nr:hypothetical protein F5Y12DRAFT_761041 [Xylaria sp. FL1777]
MAKPGRLTQGLIRAICPLYSTLIFKPQRFLFYSFSLFQIAVRNSGLFICFQRHRLERDAAKPSAEKPLLCGLHVRSDSPSVLNIPSIDAPNQHVLLARPRPISRTLEITLDGISIFRGAISAMLIPLCYIAALWLESRKTTLKCLTHTAGSPPRLGG